MRDLDEEERRAVECALGRIFKLGSRPTQPGDVEEYERCRGVILDITDPPSGRVECVASILARHRVRFGDTA